MIAVNVRPAAELSLLRLYALRALFLLIAVGEGIQIWPAILHHASRLPDFGSKMGIDATRKWKQEGFTRPWPGVIEMPAEVKQRVDALWKQAGLTL